MSKKPRPRHSPPAIAADNLPPAPAEKEPLKNPALPFQSLAAIRNHSLDIQADVQRTIAELEAWRNEIDATLAFLKAQHQ